MTIPTLMNKVGDTASIAGLRKAFSEMSQATTLIIAEEGSVENWLGDGLERVGKLYTSKMRVARECGTGVGCFESTPVKYNSLSGEASVSHSSDWNSRPEYYKFVLSDGAFVGIANIDSNCSSEVGPSYYYGHGNKNVCLVIEIDINGIKKPNAVGKDVFEFTLKKGGLYPSGADYPEMCAEGYAGYACTAKAIAEGKIGY